MGSLWNAVKRRVGVSICDAGLTEVADELTKKVITVKDYGVGRAEYVGKGTAKITKSILGIEDEDKSKNK